MPDGHTDGQTHRHTDEGNLKTLRIFYRKLLGGNNKFWQLFTFNTKFNTHNYIDIYTYSSVNTYGYLCYNLSFFSFLFAILYTISLLYIMSRSTQNLLNISYSKSALVRLLLWHLSPFISETDCKFVFNKHLCNKYLASFSKQRIISVCFAIFNRF